jgi:hypothetical protein
VRIDLGRTPPDPDLKQVAAARAYERHGSWWGDSGKNHRDLESVLCGEAWNVSVQLDKAVARTSTANLRPFHVGRRREGMAIVVNVNESDCEHILED